MVQVVPFIGNVTFADFHILAGYTFTQTLAFARYLVTDSHLTQCVSHHK
jgi:hypothetical protein